MAFALEAREKNELVFWYRDVIEESSTIIYSMLKQDEIRKLNQAFKSSDLDLRI